MGEAMFAEDGLAVVLHGTGLAVHEVGGANDVAAESRADGLMSQTDTQQRNFARRSAE